MAIKAFFQPLYLENIISTADAGSQMNMDLGVYFCGFSRTSILSSIFSRLSARRMDFSRLKDFSLAMTSC